MAAVLPFHGSYWLRGHRGLYRKLTNPPQRSYSSSATPDQLFHYTSGRWVYNERLRLEERRLYFNVDALRQVVARCLGAVSSDVQSISKLAEGGFNRILEVTLAGAGKVLVRLPYSSTQPHRYAVASEAATLDLLRSHGIPVPKVLCYSTDANNHVGAEYMILEKLQGHSLADRWYDLTGTQRLKIISQVVQLEAKLSQINLPAYGSIYYSHDLPEEVERISIPIPDEKANFCVGPAATLSWWYGKREELRIQRGPFCEPLPLLQAIAEKELAWLAAFGRSRFPFQRAYRESTGYEQSLTSAHVESLKNFLDVAQYLIPNDSKLHIPVLRHPDLQPSNILCSDDLEIVGLIDWQHSSILPQFLAAGIPNYLANYHDEESLRFVPPKLPPNFHDLQPGEQLATSEIYRRRHLHFFYLGFMQRLNPTHFAALNRRTDLLTRKIIEHASQPWEGNNVPLRADLVHLSQIWPKLLAENNRGVKSILPYPIQFTQTDQDRILDSLRQQEETDTQLEAIRNLIGISVDGWVPTDDFDEAVKVAGQIKEQALQNVDSEDERELTLRHWLFDDFDEEE